MRRIFSTILLILYFSADALTAQAAGWEPLENHEVIIKFNAPSLAGVQKSFSRISSGDGFADQGTWKSDRAGHWKAKVTYREADDDYYIGERSFEVIVKSRAYFKGKEISWGDEGSTRNAQGDISYKLFKVEDLQCGAFRQYWNEVITGDFYTDDRAFEGYFCSDPGNPLSSEELASILKHLKK